MDSEAEMLWLARPLKNRFTVTINEVGQRFGIYQSGDWEFLTNMFYGSLTAVVTMYDHGKSINLRSREGYAQRMLFVDIQRALIVGSIEITAKGGFLMTDGKNQRMNDDWPILLRQQTVAIISVPERVSLTAFDILGGKSYELRYNGQRMKHWSFPFHLRNPKKNHDDFSDEDESNSVTSMASKKESENKEEAAKPMITSEQSTAEMAPILQNATKSHDEIEAAKEDTSKKGSVVGGKGTLARSDGSETPKTTTRTELKAAMEQVAKTKVEMVSVDNVTEKKETKPVSDDSNMNAASGRNIPDNRSVVSAKSMASASGTKQKEPEPDLYWFKPGDEIPPGAHRTTVGRYFVHLKGYCPFCMGEEVRDEE